MTRQLSLVIVALLAATGTVSAQETGMFGNTPSRNMASDETGIVGEWDAASGTNVLWSQPVGSQAYGGPVVANGRVYVGTNNEGRRDPSIEGDRGVVMAFEADSGTFLWQMVHPKLTSGRVNDWPLQGVCSTAFMEGDRIYYISNEAHIVCLDARGFQDGENNGPFTDEEFTDEGAGDIIWSYDMIGELDVFPHNLATGSPLVVGDVLYTLTSNGVDEGHVNIPSPFSPDLIAVDKHTGELLWESTVVGETVLHGSWTNPAYGMIDYISSLSGFLHALDPETGEEFWTYDTFAAVWSSAFVVDGKVFLGDEDGDVAVLRAGKEMELLGEYNLGAAVYCTPVARDGVLYILTRNRIWAFKDGAQSDPL